MTPRERILGVAVGALVVAFVIGFGLWSLSSFFDARTTQLETLEKKKTDLQRALRFGTEARDLMTTYESQSLPGDLASAKTKYQDWLFDRAKERGLLEVKIAPSSEPPVEGLGRRVSYNLSAKGRLPQWVAFMHDVYSSDVLHRVNTWRINPIGESPFLDVTVGLEALWIDTNELDAMPAGKSERLAFADVESYEKSISHRNLFGLPNHAPTLDVPSSTRVALGDRASLEAKGVDVDRYDNVRLTLGKEAPQGVEISEGEQKRDAETGRTTRTSRISWTPRELGTFKIPVTVIDDGLPPMPVTETIEITVVERAPVVAEAPAPPPPEFDVAKHTRFTSVLEVNGVAEIWLLERTSGAMHRLKVGDSFRIGSLEGAVESIADRTAVLRTDDGLLRITQGQAITDAEKLTSVPDAT